MAAGHKTQNAQKQKQSTVASLGLVTPSVLTDGVNLFFP